jgi:hypothetical protein
MIIVFGSAAARGETTPPADIDVAYTGAWSDDIEFAVREWAAAHGFSADLPIDAHRVTPTNGVIELPTHDPDWTPHVVIRADPGVSVEWHTYHDLPALVRRHGSDPAALRGALQSGARLCLTDLGNSLNGDWAGYTQGLVALRYAIRHAPAWSAAGPVAEYLSELVSREDISDIVEPLRGGSPACNHPHVICRIGLDGLSAIHGDVRVPWVANLCPHAVVIRADPLAPPVASLLPDDEILPTAGSLRLMQDVTASPARIAGAPVARSALRVPTEIPAALWHIVSMPLAQAMAGRPGFVCPSTGPADEPVRDAAGQVFAVRRFTRF